jgi:hypothetical protein
MNLKQTIKRILAEEIGENRKERIYNKVVNVLTTSIYPKEKGNKIIFWFITDQLNEPIFEYNKPKKTLKVLKGRVKNYLDTFVPESLGDEFRTSVLKNVFNNLTSNSLTLNKIIVEHESMMGIMTESTFFRRRIEFNRLQKLLKLFAQQVYYETESYEQFKYELVLKCVEHIIWEDYEMGYDELPEQEEIKFVTEVSEMFDDKIKNLYNKMS